MHDLPAHIVVSSLAIYSTLQLLKRWVPALNGWLAFSVNFLLSVTSVVAFVPPDQLLTLPTLAAIATMISAAAGIHGTIKSLSPSTAEAGKTGPAEATAALAIVGVLMLLPLAGCKQVQAGPPPPLPTNAVDQIDATSNEVLQAAHGFAQRVTSDAISGKLQLSPDQKRLLSRFNGILNLADTLEVQYHNCGVARLTNKALPACDSAALTQQVTAAQKTFSEVQVSLASAAPTPSK